jgi:hypothetical protein
MSWFSLCYLTPSEINGLRNQKYWGPIFENGLKKIFYTNVVCRSSNHVTPLRLPAISTRSEGMNYMEQSPSWEITSRSATQFSNILWNPKVLYCIHRSLSWARLIQSIPFHHISLRYILILFPYLRLALLTGLFTSVFPSKKCVRISLRPCACYMPCPSHPP